MWRVCERAGLQGAPEALAVLVKGFKIMSDLPYLARGCGERVVAVFVEQVLPGA